jgi:hypothetical protein
MKGRKGRGVEDNIFLHMCSSVVLFFSRNWLLTERILGIRQILSAISSVIEDCRYNSTVLFTKMTHMKRRYPHENNLNLKQ